MKDEGLEIGFVFFIVIMDFGEKRSVRSFFLHFPSLKMGTSVTFFFLEVGEWRLGSYPGEVRDN